MPYKLNDITNNTYNSLQAINFIKIKNKNAIWLFRCSCGRSKELLAYNVLNGSTKTCGECAIDAHAFYSRGENKYNSKLTEPEIILIRQSYPTLTQKDLSSIYKVSQSNISKIILRKTWAHII